MGEERRSSPSVCLHDFFAQKFDGVLFNARYIAPRLLQTMPGITPRTGASSFTIERVRWRGSWSRPDTSCAAVPATEKGSWPMQSTFLRASHARIQKRAKT